MLFAVKIVKYLLSVLYPGFQLVLASAALQAGLSLTLSLTFEDMFSCGMAQLFNEITELAKKPFLVSA